MKCKRNLFPNARSRAVFLTAALCLIPAAAAEPGCEVYAAETSTDDETSFTVFCSAGDEIFVNDMFNISGFASGASRIELFVNLGDDETFYAEYKTDNFEEQLSLDQPGEYDIYAVAHYTDASGAETESTESTHFSVYADWRGQLEAPVINAPAAIVLGEDYTFTVDGLEPEAEGSGKAYWKVVVEHVDQVDPGTGSPLEILSLGSEDGPVPDDFVVPAELLQEGSFYRVRAVVSKGGWIGTASELCFYVAKESDENVSVTVNGSAQARVYTNVEYKVRIQASGANAAKLYTGGGNFEYHLLTDGAAEISYGSGVEAGTKSYFAMACYDAVDPETFYDTCETLNWGGVSAEATVTTVSLGQVDQAEFSAPQTIAKGEALPVEITDLGNAQWYDIRILDEFESDVEWIHSEDTQVPVTVNLRTAELEPGAQYFVVVDTYAPRMGTSRTAKELHPLSVTAPERAITVALSSETMAIGQAVNYSVYAPDAEAERLTVLDAQGQILLEQESEDDESFMSAFDLQVSGTYTVYGSARYPGQEEWVQSDETFTLVVTSKGTLPAVPQTWPDVVMAGDAITYSFDTVPDADIYLLNVKTADGAVVLNYPLYESDAGVGTLDDTDSPLESGNIYYVSIEAFGMGYESAETEEHPVAVVDPGKVLTLPADLTTIEEEAFKGVDAQMIVIPAGVTSVSDRAFAACQNLIAVVSPTLQPDATVFEDCPNQVIVTTGE